MMDNIRNIKKALIAGGVSWRHVQRYGRELQAHYEDLRDKAIATGFEEEAATRWAQKELGDPDILVREMASKPELQCLGSRYPKLVFLAVPLLTFFAIMAVIILGIVGYMNVFYPSTGEQYEYPGFLKSMIDAIRLFIMHGLAPLLSCIFLVYGMRQDIPRKWLYTGIFLVNLFGCALLIRINWPDPLRNITEGSIGATLGYGFYDIRGVMDTKIRLLLTLMMLGLFGWWYRKRLARD